MCRVCNIVSKRRTPKTVCGEKFYKNNIKNQSTEADTMSCHLFCIFVCVNF